MAKSRGRCNIRPCRSATMPNPRRRRGWCRSSYCRDVSNSALAGRACRLYNILIRSTRSRIGCLGSPLRSAAHRLCRPRPEAEATEGFGRPPMESLDPPQLGTCTTGRKRCPIGSLMSRRRCRPRSSRRKESSEEINATRCWGRPGEGGHSRFAAAGRDFTSRAACRANVKQHAWSVRGGIAGCPARCAAGRPSRGFRSRPMVFVPPGSGLRGCVPRRRLGSCLARALWRNGGLSPRSSNWLLAPPIGALWC